MNISGNEIRKGDLVKFENKLWQCLVAQHRTPGNLRAFIQVKLRNIMDNTQKEVRFSSTDRIEKIDIFERKMQFLYNDSSFYKFMDLESYDEVSLSAELIGDDIVYITPDMELTVAFYESKPLFIKLPQTMEFEVTEADPEIRGATASASYKTAVLSNGLKIQVPQFVKPGDVIKINTESREYLERAKK